MNKDHYENQKNKDIYEKYREILEVQDLSKDEIDKMRQHLRSMAQTICEHVWEKKFY